MSLTINHARLGYDSFVVCEDLNYEVPEGSFTVILGPNGCGKSTMLRALARALRPTSGTVELAGEDLFTIKPKKVAQQVAFLPQHPIVPTGMRVKDLVARGRHPYHTAWRRWSTDDKAAVATALAVTSMSELADDIVAELSGGQRQRAWLAMVVAQQTNYVLLDEPTSFLDVAHQLEVLELSQRIVSEGQSVVAVLHDITQAARYADIVTVMHDGRIVAHGHPLDVLTSELLADVFGIDATVSAHPYPQVTINGRLRP